MSYYLDKASGDILYATVILTNVERPDRPAVVVSVAELLSGNRFLEVADTCLPL